MLYRQIDRATIGAGDGGTAMNADTGMLVPVRCAWNAWQTVEVRLEDLQNVHWYQPPGAPRPMLHAYVDCTKTGGRIAHDCERFNLGLGRHAYALHAPLSHPGLYARGDREPAGWRSQAPLLLRYPIHHDK